MRLIPLEIGRVEGDLRAITGEDGWVTLPVAGWLIEHRHGLALFDTGMHADLQHTTARIGRNAEVFKPDFKPGEELTAQLSRHGIHPGDVAHVILSHLHFDHAGGTCEIPDARLVVQRAEWEAGHNQQLVDAGVYTPDDYDLGHDVQLIDGTHDLMGDGSIVCIPTPGHTPGHQSLRVELDSGPVVLAADCIYFQRMLDTMTVPRFGTDLDQQFDSMHRLAAMQTDGCRLIFGHDLEQFREIPIAGLI
ncbi:MAG: N-acyl homoserine lactonase family protein [Actinomycetia bacterium]|nr:N-acyl homoserine lactonase family protein [Actinomycetes bacterium]MCP4961284.1 N-acyl homoserine lactonase family protein [Actinomycetes bacterium]